MSPPDALEEPEEVAAGYLLVRPVPRPVYASASLLPDELLSASDCICPRFPDPSAIDWVAAAEEARIEALDAVGLPAERRREARDWATARFGVDFGWPGVFDTAAAAAEVRERFFGPASGLRLLGLGLPRRHLDAFIAEATPPPPEPGFSPQGESGYLHGAKARQPLAAGGQRLGFELLDVEAGQLGCSWLCNGLESHCAAALGVRPNARGLVDDPESAERCRGEIAREEIGAEPGLWLPWLLVEYP